MLFAISAIAYAQEPIEAEKTVPYNWNIKTNILYDATTTFNLGGEVRLTDHSSLDLSANYNPWTFKNNRKWKHIMVQPEYRRWFKETYVGDFVGVHLLYAFYNIGNLPSEIFSDHMRDNRFEGWAAGIGVSYGYRWRLSDRMGLEAEIGVGYVYTEYDRFDCAWCGEFIASEKKHFFMPTKAAVNLIYNLGRKPVPAPVVVEVPVIPEPDPINIVPSPVRIASTTEGKDAVIRTKSGSAYLDFKVGQAVIEPSFRGNSGELNKIYASLQEVAADTTVRIKDIEIVGYASPEGTAANNLTLSSRRAEALRSYLMNSRGVTWAVVSSRGMGEDWATLDSLVNNSWMDGSYMMLDIIRNTPDPDVRERRLRALGAPYQYVIANIYPQLRRTDYNINFTYVAEEAIAARIDAERLVLNEASEALARKDVVAAARALSTIKGQGDDYWNNMGVLEYLQGRTKEAAECFAKAGEAGAANAAELNRYIQNTTI